MANYSGKNAIIIGGTYGIGLATAKLLLSHGVNLIITGHRPESLAAAAQELGPSVLAVLSDIASLPAHAELEQTAEQRFGSGAIIDLLFINSGTGGPQAYDTLTEELWDEIFNVNTKGPMFMAKRMVPHIRPGGSIIFSAGVFVNQGYPGLSIFSPAKAAIACYARDLASELLRGADGKEGIRVNSISYGVTDTPMIRLALENADLFKDLVSKNTATLLPMGRMGTEEEMAKGVVYLAFDATYSTGTELLIDGGIRHTLPVYK